MRSLLICTILLLIPPSLLAQTPAPTPPPSGGKVIVDGTPVTAPLDGQSITDGPPVIDTPGQTKEAAWKILSDAVADKRSDTRIQALAALGTLPEPRAYALIEAALADTDIDTRTAAVLAAGQTHDLRLIGKLHAMLDDKEPQVAFAAATTLWKMHDRSGEDILVAVADGDRKANATFVNGTLHTANKDFHNPSTIARLGVEQGAAILLGPFGFGLTAYEAMRRNGGSSARVTAIDQLAESHTGPIRAELLSALTDKDPGVRAAAAKALGAYPRPRSPSCPGQPLRRLQTPSPLYRRRLLPPHHRQTIHPARQTRTLEEIEGAIAGLTSDDVPTLILDRPRGMPGRLNIEVPEA